MKTTLRKLYEKEPCSEGAVKLLTGLGYKCTSDNWETVYTNLTDSDKDSDITIRFILDNNGIDDAFWSLRTIPDIQVMPILADIGESVLHIFEEVYPNDKRPRNLINGIRLFCQNEISKDGLDRLDKEAARAAWAARAALAAREAREALAARAALASRAAWAARAARAAREAREALAAWEAWEAWAARAARASRAARAAGEARDEQNKINREILLNYI
jgi:hypothetical protein